MHPKEASDHEFVELAAWLTLLRDLGKPGQKPQTGWPLGSLFQWWKTVYQYNPIYHVRAVCLTL